MDVQRGQREVVSLDETVHVDQPQHEALVAAARVLEDAVEVPVVFVFVRVYVACVCVRAAVGEKQTRRGRS